MMKWNEYIRWGIVALLIVVSGATTMAANFRQEALHYDIVYHWGVIWKHAASATLSISPKGATYYDTRLTAHTRSWADKLYKVRDTLSSTIERTECRPIRYVKAAHEGGTHNLDSVIFTNHKGSTSAQCTRVRDGVASEFQLETTGNAYDMLSIFFYLRTLDYDAMNVGDKLVTSVFSGKRKEYVRITYRGKETVKMRDGTTHSSHHVIFSFYTDKEKKSSDGINAWLSTDSRHIPLLLKGSVSIGEVRVYYADAL